MPRPVCPRTRTSACPRASRSREQDDPRDHGGRESDPPPWDDATTPLSPAAKPPRDDGHNPSPTPPWGFADAKAVALSDLVPSAAPTIDEMLTLMAKQIMEVITWTRAEGFTEAYRGAGANARDLFLSVVIKLAARADQIRTL